MIKEIISSPRKILHSFKSKSTPVKVKRKEHVDEAQYNISSDEEKSHEHLYHSIDLSSIKAGSYVYKWDVSDQKVKKFLVVGLSKLTPKKSKGPNANLSIKVECLTPLKTDKNKNEEYVLVKTFDVNKKTIIDYTPEGSLPIKASRWETGKVFYVYAKDFSPTPLDAVYHYMHVRGYICEHSTLFQKIVNCYKKTKKVTYFEENALNDAIIKYKEINKV